MAVVGLRLYGVASLDAEPGTELPRDTRFLSVRELAAVVCDAPFARGAADDASLADYQHVIEAVFRQHTILPAPFGTVFKSGDHLTHWLDRNYIALSEGVHFLDGRCEGRVHFTSIPEVRGDRRARGERGDRGETDTANAASEAFRTLRRYAAAAVPLRRSADPTRIFSGAFLLERGRWDEFSELIREQASRYAELEFEQTGPWPPYDFVRMEIGV